MHNLSFICCADSYMVINGAYRVDNGIKSTFCAHLLISHVPEKITMYTSLMGTDPKVSPCFSQSVPSPKFPRMFEWDSFCFFKPDFALPLSSENKSLRQNRKYIGNLLLARQQHTFWFWICVPLCWLLYTLQDYNLDAHKLDARFS